MEGVKPTLEEVARTATPEERLSLRQMALAAIAGAEDSPAGYIAFYEGIFGGRMPRHARKWVDNFYKARAEGKDYGLMAFRLSTKTTTVTIGFSAFQIGHHPERANMIIQAGGDQVKDALTAITDKIQSHPFWKQCFPHVVPDTELGWSVAGYQVKRTDMDYGEWRKLNSKRQDPTLTGYGYESRTIIGNHPDGLLIVDDILDENNTVSRREMEKCRQRIKSEILPCSTPTTFAMWVFTPWRDDDPVMEQMNSGEYFMDKTPAFTEDPAGEDVWEGRPVTYTWENFGEKELKKRKAKSGDVEFARMYLLDLTKSKGRLFHYQTFDHTKINPGWLHAGGVDYASIDNTTGETDFFAMAYGAKRPEVGMVIVGGILEKPTQGQAEGYILQAPRIFPIWRTTGIELDGKGQEFYSVVSRNPGIMLQPIKTHGKAKESRYREMAPQFENGLIVVSDQDTPFLNELRYELDNYTSKNSLPHDDALDAVYDLVCVMPDAVNMPIETGEIKFPQVYNNKREVKSSPYNSIASRFRGR
jgi:hypothetical protein